MKSGDSPIAEPVSRERTWQVDLAIVERDGHTTAHAYLVGDGPLLTGDGRVRRRSPDAPESVAEDEIAVARALRQLADRLLGAAATDIGLLEGSKPAAVARR